MVFEYFVLLSAAFALTAGGSLTDIKTREVPDWMNYSGIAIGLGLRALYSIYTFDYSFILAGIFGFGIFFLVSLGMFYTGQWGGGDSKMLMALGAILGFELRPDNILISFFVNMLFVGALYGIFWSIFLAFRNRQKFIHNLGKLASKPGYKKSRTAVVAVALSGAFVSVFIEYPLSIALLGSSFAVFASFYAWAFLVSVEKASMVKSIPVEALTEGDWIVHDVVVQGKRICGPKDLGISLEQIDELAKLKKKGLVDRITIKEGMPFVPSFFMSLAVSAFLGNIALFFV